MKNTVVVRPLRIGASLAFVALLAAAYSAAPQSPSVAAGGGALGRTSTLLPDGRVLLVGGQDDKGNATSAAVIKDPRTGTESTLPRSLAFARMFHTATVLPDGTVLILGGIGNSGALVARAELFRPETATFELVDSGLTPRAFHTATLLTDGRLVVAGGASASGELFPGLELWNYRQAGALKSGPQLHIPRRNHTAQLLPDGSMLLLGGRNRDSNELGSAEAYDPLTDTIVFIAKSDRQGLALHPEVQASIPADGDTEVSPNVLVSVRFSRPIDAESVNRSTFRLEGPDGPVHGKVVAAEAGMLAFFSPDVPLQPGQTYTGRIASVTARGGRVPDWSFSFTTAPQPDESDSGEPGEPAEPSADGQGHTPDVPLRKAPPGVTALSGRVLALDGRPLAGVLLEISGQTDRTDGAGRFLLANIRSERQEMLIDASPASKKGKTYGVFEVGVDVLPAQTNFLPYIIWMPELDMANAVTIPSPTNTEVVVTTPRIPGLELRIPAKTVITDHKGQIVTQVSITPIPVDRPPFPLPRGVVVPTYFTIQPGGAYLHVSSYHPHGARLIYPNAFNHLPGTRFDFWNYDAEDKGWYIYGYGTVLPDGKQVVPDRGTYIYEFTGAMVSDPSVAPSDGPPGNGAEDGDPVDLATGLFVYNKTDLVVDDTIPIVLTRTYRQGDTRERPFGVGASHNYEMLMVGDINPYTWQELILPDGGRVHYDRISPGTGFNGAVYEHTTTQGRFYKSTVTYSAGWHLKLKDGTVYVFPDAEGNTNPRGAALLEVRNRYGQVLKLDRDSERNLTKITTPNGRWIEFTYLPGTGSNDRIVSARDNIGRTVSYTYDPAGRLETVADANGSVTRYTYDVSSRMTQIKDARGIVYLTNEYDISGRVIRQTQADQSTYQFSYVTGSNGRIAEATVVLPDATTRKVTFNTRLGYAGSGYTPPGLPLSNTAAFGSAQARTTSIARVPDTNFVSSSTDALGRRTDYAYDDSGNLTSVTRLAGTAEAVTTSFTYEPNFHRVRTITDPLNHATTFEHDPKGNVTAIEDPLGQRVSMIYNASGQVLSLTDALGNTSQFSYDGPDLVRVTNPLGNSSTRFVDNAGRTLAMTSPLGQTTRYTYDNLNNLLSITDAIGGETSFTYDANGNLLTVTDARGNTTGYEYDNMDRVVSRTDPLLRTETYQYDLRGNLIEHADRRGKRTTFQYDDLNRRSFVGFGTVGSGQTVTYESTINYNFDAADRLLNLVDSTSGTITFGYDNLDRRTSETTPQGSISYMYDADDRRSTMTVAGQPVVTYDYDNANRLLSITQSTSVVAFTYDDANRRRELALPNGIRVQYSYDNVSRLTGINYVLGANTLGTLTYGYDAAGRRTSMGGSFARTGLPQPLSSASYDAANQLTRWGTVSLSYDTNGNLISDGLSSYSWNARNQLASLGAINFQYDGLGRRIRNAAGTQFLYDGVNPVQELSGATPLANLLSGSVDEVFTRTDSVGASSFLADALGSTVALADSGGIIETQYTYDPFGATSSIGPSYSSYTFTGRENDGNGLHYHRARYYSAQTGRFISQDPIGLRGGINLYAYAAQNPVSNTDRSGLCTDPGGSGLRYCVEAYIPHSRAWLGPIWFGGDDRGPRSDGGSYRWHQDYGSNGGHCAPGTSTLFGAFGAEASMSYCDVTRLPGRKGKRKLRFRAAGGDGWAPFGGAPDAGYDIVAVETDFGTYTTGFATDYPNVEVWQYSDNAPPRLIFHSETSWGPFTGPLSLIPPNPMVPLPPR